MSRVEMWLPRKAGAAVAAHRIVKPSADGTVIQGAAKADALLGVSGSRAVASGDTVEVAVVGIADVEAGAAVTRGALVSSDANGKATPAAAAGDRVVGIAVEAAADGDIFPVLIAPSQLK